VLKRALVVLALAASLSACPSLRTYWRPSSARLVVDGASYGPAEKQRLDLWAPEGAAGAPLVVFVHGGTWSSGDRDYYAPITGLYGNVAKALADEGIATAVLSYRYWPDVALDDMLDDVAAGTRTAIARAAEAGADPRRVILAGHSSGAHLAAMLGARPELLAARGVDPSVIRGVVGISTPLDAERAVQRSKNPAVPAVFPPDVRAAASPMRFLAKAPVPFLFLIGEKDLPGLRIDFYEARAMRLRNTSFVEVQGRTHAEMILWLGVEGDPSARAIARWVRAAAGSTG
jgi:acetyl esterase/lipase